MKRSTISAAMLLFSVSFAAADPPLAADESREPAIAPYVTSTGATVDKPGQSQSGGPTRLDRKIQRQDNRIDKSICKGC